MPQFDFAYILRSPAYYADNASFLEDLRAVRHAGFKAIELQLKSPYDLEQPMLRRMLADEALRLAGFQTGSAYRSQRLCLASPDAVTRRRTVDLLKRYVDLAASFSAVVVFGLLQGTRADEGDSVVALERIRTHLAEIGDHATAADVTVAIEPVNRYEADVFHNTVDEVVQTVRVIAKSSLVPMVDTFHVNIEERSQRSAILDAQSAIAHVHLSETNRGLFGTGHLDLREVFETLQDIGYAGTCSVGVYREFPVFAQRCSHSSEAIKLAMKSMSTEMLTTRRSER